MEEKKCSICGEVKPLSEFYSQINYSKSKGKYIYYRPDCKRCTSTKNYKWQKDNPKKRKKYYDKWNQDPRHKIIHKKCNEEHRKSGKYNEWQNRNKTKVKYYNFKRKNKKHDISQKEWDDCRIYFNFRCAYCGKTWEQNKKETKKDLHKEHVIHDGRNDLKNCVPSCMSCNSSKSETSLNNWYNSKNHIYTYERYLKIYIWLRYDCLKYIKKKKKRKKAL